MKRRFEDKGPNFLFIGAAVLVLFGMIWLSCHQNEFIEAFTDDGAAAETPSGSLRSPAPPETPSGSLRSPAPPETPSGSLRSPAPPAGEPEPTP